MRFSLTQLIAAIVAIILMLIFVRKERLAQLNRELEEQIALSPEDPREVLMNVAAFDVNETSRLLAEVAKDQKEGPQLAFNVAGVLTFHFFESPLSSLPGKTAINMARYVQDRIHYEALLEQPEQVDLLMQHFQHWDLYVQSLTHVDGIPIPDAGALAADHWLSNFDTVVPIGLFVRQTWRAAQAIKRGEERLAVLAQWGVNLGTKGVGWKVGAAAGGAIGLKIDGILLGQSMGAATVIGTVVGGATGMQLGAKVAHAYRTSKINPEQESLAEALCEYGDLFIADDAEKKIKDLVFKPLEQAQIAVEHLAALETGEKRKVRFWIYPSAKSVLVAQTHALAIQQHLHLQTEVYELNNYFYGLFRSKDASFLTGIMMYSNQELAHVLSPSIPSPDRVRDAQERLNRARQKAGLPVPTSTSS